MAVRVWAFLHNFVWIAFQIVPLDFDKVGVTDRGLVTCPDGGDPRILDLSDEFQYLISSNGSLVSLGGDYEASLPLGDVCLDLGQYSKTCRNLQSG
jgi:hypothetical protein